MLLREEARDAMAEKGKAGRDDDDGWRQGEGRRDRGKRERGPAPSARARLSVFFSVVKKGMKMYAEKLRDVRPEIRFFSLRRKLPVLLRA